MGDYLFSVVLTIHVLVGIGVIGLVLMQHGKGADAGAAFGGGGGGGGAGSVFGASGSANFLSRTTAALATVFFLTSLGLAYLANKPAEAPSSVMDGAVPAQQSEVPAVSAPDVSAPASAEEIPTPAQDVPVAPAN